MTDHRMEQDKPGWYNLVEGGQEYWDGTEG
jgi:hypothetical protein